MVVVVFSEGEKTDEPLDKPLGEEVVNRTFNLARLCSCLADNNEAPRRLLVAAVQTRHHQHTRLANVEAVPGCRSPSGDECFVPGSRDAPPLRRGQARTVNVDDTRARNSGIASTAASCAVNHRARQSADCMADGPVVIACCWRYQVAEQGEKRSGNRRAGDRPCRSPAIIHLSLSLARPTPFLLLPRLRHHYHFLFLFLFFFFSSSAFPLLPRPQHRSNACRPCHVSRLLLTAAVSSLSSAIAICHPPRCPRADRAFCLRCS